MDKASYMEENNGQSSPLGVGGKIFLIGFMGCGKTHWGRLLSQHLHLPFFDLDEKIAEKEGKSINAIFSEQGEEYFRLAEKETLYMLTESHDDFIMACGGGTPCYFNNIDYMNRNGKTIWINCSVNCLHSRLIKEKNKRPLIKDLTSEQLKAFIVKKFGDRRIYYQQAAVILNEDELTLDTLLAKITSS